MKKKIMQPTKLYEEAKRRLNEVDIIIQELEARSIKYPNERIHVVTSKNRIQFYIRKDAGGDDEYLSSTQKSKIKQLLQKRYEKKVLKYLSVEKQNLQKFLEKSENIPQIIQNIYSDYSSEIKFYVDPIEMSDFDCEKSWLEEEYEKKELSDNVPQFITDKGDHVRSKSELNIANALFKNGIPYKYECPIVLRNGIKIHPDFTVLDVRKRKEVYWEHRGMMDDREYAKHAVHRVNEYAHNGIFLGDNLIITEETQSNPLGTKQIEQVIHHYFDRYL